MKFEAIVVRRTDQNPIKIEISPKNPTYYQNYDVSAKYLDDNYEYHVFNLFDGFEALAFDLIEKLKDKTIKLRLVFDTYFESRFKSKSKARELIEDHHLILHIDLCAVPSRLFNEDFDLQISGQVSFSDTKIPLFASDFENLFDQLYYGLKNLEEIRICLFCKHFGRFPDTKMFPTYCNSMCWHTEPVLHSFYQQNSALFDELFEHINPGLIKSRIPSLDQENNEGIENLVNKIDEIIAIDEKTMKKLIDCENITQKILLLTRRIPIENCNYWEKRSM